MRGPWCGGRRNSCSVQFILGALNSHKRFTFKRLSSQAPRFQRINPNYRTSKSFINPQNNTMFTVQIRWTSTSFKVCKYLGINAKKRCWEINSQHNGERFGFSDVNVVTVLFWGKKGKFYLTAGCVQFSAL